MKNNLEQNLKQSLENHEMPYNPEAWKAMKAKLDVVKPIQSPASNLKWYISAASVAVLGIASYLFLSQNDENVNKSTDQIENTKLTADTTESNDAKEHEINSSTPTAEDNSKTATEGNSESTKTNNKETNTNPSSNYNPFVMSSNGNQNGPGTGNSSSQTSGTNHGSTSTNGPSTTPVKNYFLPQLNDVCEGEVITIKNTNDVAITVNGPEIHYMIPANSERKVRINKEGSHELSVSENGVSQKSSNFYVKRAPKTDFIIDTDTKFENGLPTTKMETSVPGVEHAWVIGKSRFYGEKVDAHFFKAGNHDVTLTVKDINGCTSSTTKSVRIDEKYNLMAVNSFIPDDLDQRNNTFMPFALTQRNVRFNLIIIDPTDGHTVFQSNDASNPWNGIDKTTGNGVNYGTTYIWKVTIENTEPNENNEYAGNITPIQKR